MKNIVLKVIVAIIIVACSCGEVKSQASFLGNNSVDPTDFSGWDNTVTFPLEIRHDAFRPIVFSTDGAERMRIAEFGNISVGGDVSPNQKFAVMLHNNNAAAAPNFESTAIFAFNRFASEEPGGQINRGLRAISTIANVGSPLIDFHGVNMAGSFFATRALLNVGIEANVSWFEDFNEEGPDFAGLAGVGIQSGVRDHRQENVAVRGRARAHSNEPNAWTVAIHGAVEQLISTNYRHQSHSSRTLMTS